MHQNLRSDAFLTQAMDTCGDSVYRLALCRLGSPADAEDIYQEVFLRLLQDTTEFQDTEHLKAWLIRVTISRCNDLRRSAWFKRTAPLEAAADAAAPALGEYAELWQAVYALPADLRTAVYLHYVEGYRTEEIAAIAGCPAATVRTRLYRARKQLKLELEESDYENQRPAPFTGHQSARNPETTDAHFRA